MGRQISQGNKTLEIRFWRPEQWSLKDLMNYLEAKGETEALAKMEAYRVKYGV